MAAYNAKVEVKRAISNFYALLEPADYEQIYLDLAKDAKDNPGQFPKLHQ